MKTARIPFKILSIEGDGYHLQLTIRINGKFANVLVDTGASKTVFDKERAKKFTGKKKFDKHEKVSTGLGTNSMESHVTTLDSLKIGTIEIKNYNTVLLDLHHVNESYKEIGLKQIDGVIGSDLLKKYKAVIDYGTKHMKLTTPKSRRK